MILGFFLLTAVSYYRVSVCVDGLVGYIFNPCVPFVYTVPLLRPRATEKRERGGGTERLHVCVIINNQPIYR